MVIISFFNPLIPLFSILSALRTIRESVRLINLINKKKKKMICIILVSLIVCRRIHAQAARETGALQAAKNKLEKQVEELTWRLQLEKRMRVLWILVTYLHCIASSCTTSTMPLVLLMSLFSLVLSCISCTWFGYSKERKRVTEKY